MENATSSKNEPGEPGVLQRALNSLPSCTAKMVAFPCLRSLHHEDANNPLEGWREASTGLPPLLAAALC